MRYDAREETPIELRDELNHAIKGLDWRPFDGRKRCALAGVGRGGGSDEKPGPHAVVFR